MSLLFSIDGAVKLGKTPEFCRVLFADDTCFELGLRDFYDGICCT